MVNRSSLDPIEEARARVRLRHTQAKAVYVPSKPFGQLAMRLARKKTPKGSTSLVRLKLQWESIVGKQIAGICRPEKLSAGKGGRQLTLKVIPAAATPIQHQSEMIRQRVSVAAGGDITTIKIIQGPLTKLPASPGKPRRKTLSVNEEKLLQDSCAGIQHHDLRAAIVSLGRAVLVNEKL
ncbi:MAG: hypothetical protein CME93_07585 [Hyphomonadaceae bacterium]|nr:hypothetical protein [Hyphomonadaceae bacterium]OUX93304.1 MAG: hypothetical protein CBB77_09635 [Hyphomonas sp. TMED17]CAI8346680.1 MAG: Uncharacterised protein [Hyphomonas sp. TMED17]